MNELNLSSALPAPETSRFSRFDVAVWSIAALLLGASLLLIFIERQEELELVAQTPAPGAVVSSRSQIRITFAEPLTQLPQPALSFSPPVSGTAAIDGNTMIFQPNTPLEEEVLYQITLNPGIRGERHTLSEPVTWAFETSPPRILYIEPDEEAANQVMIVNPDEATAVPLTASATSVLDYTVAPDSSRIAYSAAGSDTTQPAAADLWLINADGSGAEMILPCPDAACTRPVWMPDGQRLLYEKRNIPAPGAAPGNPRLWWLDLQSGATVPVFQDSQLLGMFAAVSPNGEWLSFVAPLEQGIRLFNLVDGRNLLIPNRMGSAASWRPDGDTIALSDIITSDEEWQIVISAIDIATQETRLLSVDGETDDSNPTWSPDGSRLALERKQARTPMGRQIWLMDPDGSAAVPLTADTQIHHGQIQWSPNGGQILYQRYDLDELYAQPGVWLIDIASGNTREIAYPAMQPAWLP